MMAEFFKPLRRKIGLVTLVIASACVVGWLWSINGSPKATIPTKFDIEFVRSGIHVLMSQQTNTVIALKKFADRTEPQYDIRYILDLTMPYWSVVIPLTLLSAYLLLSKPRVLKTPSSTGAVE